MTTSMQGKTCLITGATNGIGKETALALAKMGATVIMVGRSAQKTDAAVAEIRAESGNQNVSSVLADLSLVAQVHDLGQRIRGQVDRLDVLVNNAGGVFMAREVTAEGIELTWALNHLSYFVLTGELLDLLKATPESRVVSVSSDAHRGTNGINFDDLYLAQKYAGFSAYAQSKLANVLFTYELARRLEGTGVTANAVHPGMVATGFGSNIKGVMKIAVGLAMRFGASPEKGASTSVYLASSPEVKGITGKYFTNKKAVQSSSASYDKVVAERLWHVTEETVAKILQPA